MKASATDKKAGRKKSTQGSGAQETIHEAPLDDDRQPDSDVADNELSETAPDMELDEESTSDRDLDRRGPHPHSPATTSASSLRAG